MIALNNIYAQIAKDVFKFKQSFKDVADFVSNLMAATYKESDSAGVATTALSVYTSY